jgi:hypothetical protein
MRKKIRTNEETQSIGLERVKFDAKFYSRMFFFIAKMDSGEDGDAQYCECYAGSHPRWIRQSWGRTQEGNSYGSA